MFKKISLILLLFTFCLPSYAEDIQNKTPETAQTLNQTEEAVPNVQEEAKRQRQLAKYYKRVLEREHAIGVQQKIFENWKPVKYMLYSHQYKNDVTAEVQINRSGEIDSCRIVHTSMDKKAENNAIKTIETAAPFGPFPDEITKNKLIIRIRFNNYSALGPSYRYE